MNFKDVFEKIKYFLLDMDGTLYLGDELIGRMDITLDLLRSRGKKIIYLTNNSSKTPEEYANKLKRLNLWGAGDEVYTSGMATAEYLKEFFPTATVNLLGTAALKKDFESRGISVVERGADVCVLAYDTELTYKKLCDFCYDLKKGATYIATHPDVNCPAPEVFVPDAGAFMAMIERSTKRSPQVVVGKPNGVMGDRLLKKYNAVRENFIMVGDRLHTDIKFGNNCLFFTALVLSGESTAADIPLQDARPDFVFDSLNDITKII